MSDSHLIWTRIYEKALGYWVRRGFTQDEIYQSGYRDGRDGIKYYSCIYWDREGLADPKIYGNTVKADDVYQHGYKCGRLHWKHLTGSFPSTGADWFDSEIAKAIAETAKVNS